MADLRNQLAEVYVKVSVETKSASEAAKKQAEMLREQAKGHQEVAQKAREAMKKVDKLGESVNKKEINRILKATGLNDLKTKEEIKNLEKTARAEARQANRQERLSKKRMRQHEMTEQFIRTRITRFTEFSGQMDDKDLKGYNAKQQQKAAAYQSFLKRASSEHSRFVTRLDQRDMTASTLENMKRGFAKGMLVGNKWHKDENSLQRIGRSIGIASGSLNKMKDDSEMALMSFQRLQRVGYSLQAAIGAIAGTIGSLVGGLMSLVGVLGQASYALVAVGSAFASIIAGGIAARIALGGVGQAVSAMLDPQKKLQGALRNTRRELRNLRFEAEEAALSQEEAAINLEKAREELARVQDLPPDSRVRRETELQFQQAELAYRRAKARNKDAREDLKKGPVGGGGMADPLAKLTDSQKAFAKYLVTLKPQMDELKEAAASGFLPILQTSIETLVAKAFPTLKSGLNILGTAMGNASKSFADAFTTPENLELLDEFFKSSKPVIEAFGRTAGNALGGILGLLKAAQPLTERFSKWIESSSEKFENWGKGSGLEKFLNLSGDVAASLGGVISTVFGGLKNILDATFPGGDVNAGAGGVLLRWLQKIADGFKAFTGSADFAAWLQGATSNATTALSAIGTLLKPIMDIAAMPEIGQFWTILSGAAEPIKKMLEDGAKAAPEFAEMLVSIVKMFSLFSDSGALESFFNTLKAIADGVSFILEGLKPILDFWGRIHGVLLAVGLAIMIAKTVFMVMSGITKTVFLTLGRVADVMNTITVKTYAASSRFRDLKKEGHSAAGALARIPGEFMKMAAQAKAKRRAAVLIQMAQDAGMTTRNLKTLSAQLDEVIMKQGIYSKGGMAAAVQKSRPRSLGKGENSQILNTVSGRTSATGRPGFAGGRAATGALGAVGAVGSMAGGSGPVSGMLGGAAMIASFLPGPLGLISGAVLGIGSAIAGGFEAAAQAEKEKKEAEKQRKIEIQAQNAEIIAENLDQQQTTVQGLVDSGATFKNVQDKITNATTIINEAAIEGVTNAKDALGTLITTGFADTFAKGSKDQQKSLIGNIESLMQATDYSFEQAAEILGGIYKEGGSGAKGVKAVEKYVKDKGAADTVVVTDETGTKQSFTVSKEEGDRLKAQWAARDKKRNDLETESSNLNATKVGLQALDPEKTYIEQTANVSKWNNPAVYTALGMNEKQFEAKFFNTTTRTWMLQEIRDALTKANTEAQARYNAILIPPADPTTPAAPAANTAPTSPVGAGAGGGATPWSRAASTFVPASPASITAPSGPTGPKGTTADPLTVNTPALDGLGPAITKLANATPSVVVVQVKNASDLAAQFKKLGINVPAGT
jgi:hypothetical protein